MTSEICSFCAGLLVGAAAIVIISIIPGSVNEMYHSAIELCEKDLPRNQQCEITAIVKESE